MEEQGLSSEKWILVEHKLLPEVFGKVLQAKQYLASGQAETSVEAARMAGLSRSAFYKYKDAVYLYAEQRDGRLMTINLRLFDRPGVLSDVLGVFKEAGINIQTVNQSVPSGGTAAVSVSAHTDSMCVPEERLLAALAALPGVEKVTGVIRAGAVQQTSEEETT